MKNFVVCLVAVVCGIVGVAANPAFDLGESDALLFEAFIKAYERNYSLAEKETRFAAFQENLETARQLNASAHEAGDNVVYGITRFSDYTHAELARLRGAHQQHAPQRQQRALDSGCPDIACNVASLPATFDWRADPRGVVTAVGYQGLCGCCWAFSATETLESAYVLAGNVLAGKLSVQQVVSCDHTDNGCVGGSVRNALNFIMTNPIGYDSGFPFQCTNGCASSGQPPCPPQFSPYATINASFSCADKSEDYMRCLLMKFGPMGVRVDADPWVAYAGGIIRHGCSPEATAGDHAVQVTGFSVDTTTSPPTPYWIVRNSWSTTWGEEGYVRIARNSNVCGIANEVVMATSPRQ